MSRSRAHQRLFQATHELHRALDSAPLLRRLLSPSLSRQEYTAIMYRMHQALSLVEPAVRHVPGYIPGLPALRADLYALGLPPTSADDANSQAQPCAGLGACLGMRYVLEGASQGAVVILRSLDRLPAGVCADALGYWRLQAGLAERWPAFVENLAPLEVDNHALEQAVEAAITVFRQFQQVFMGAPA